MALLAVGNDQQGHNKADVLADEHRTLILTPCIFLGLLLLLFRSEQGHLQAVLSPRVFVVHRTSWS